MLSRHTDLIGPLVRAEQIRLVDSLDSDEIAARGVVRGVQMAIPLAGLLDLDSERARLGRELTKLTRELDSLFAEGTLEEWTKRLEGARLIWAPVRSHVEATADPTAETSGLFPTVDHPDHGQFRTVSPPLRMSEHPMPGNAPAPGLGSDTAAVLSEAGVDDDTIALLVAAAS